MNRNGQANIEVNLPSEVPIDSVTISYAFKDGAATDVVDLDAYTGYLTAQKAGTTIIVTTIKAVTDKPIQKTMEILEFPESSKKLSRQESQTATLSIFSFFAS